MTCSDLIFELIVKGIALIPGPGGALKARAPRGTLTPQLKEELGRHKRTILRRMRAIERAEPEPVHRGLHRLLDPDEREDEVQHQVQVALERNTEVES